MHFFNPAPLNPLIEVIPGIKTSKETTNTILDLSKELGKDPVLIKEEVAGFVINRIMIAGAIEAIKIFEQKIASVDEIDKAVKAGLN